MELLLGNFVSENIKQVFYFTSPACIPSSGLLITRRSQRRAKRSAQRKTCLGPALHPSATHHPPPRSINTDQVGVWLWRSSATGSMAPQAEPGLWLPACRSGESQRRWNTEACQRRAPGVAAPHRSPDNAILSRWGPECLDCF